jgi:hypothetical protein
MAAAMAKNDSERQPILPDPRSVKKTTSCQLLNQRHSPDEALEHWPAT